MPRALSACLRQALLDQAAAGCSCAALAAAFSVSVRSVQRYLARSRCPGPDPLRPGYHRCGRTVAPSRAAIRSACIDLRRQHPGWGAARIRLSLRQRFAASDVPPPRTLRRWLAHNEPIVPALPAVHRAATVRASVPHQVWQMDAVEGLRLRDGSGASWLRLVDECSGAILWTELFPPQTLGRRGGQRRAGGLAGSVWPLGLPGPVAGGQRPSLGSHRRVADSAGVVGRRSGGAHAPQPTSLPAEQWGRRVVARGDATLG